MMPRPLTDDQLAAGLQAHLPVAHAGLHERILAEITRTPQERQLPSILGRLTDADPMARRRMTLLVAVVALALLVSVTAMAGALLREQRTPDLSLDRQRFVDMSGERVLGWPSTGQNVAGVYSWDSGRCSSVNCIYGFMHNGYGSGDVTIRIAVVPAGSIPDDGGTPVTVAGHDGIYRRVNDRLEEWSADILGSTIAIRLETRRRGTSPTDLAEAHAIIASMGTELRDNSRGFRLVFTLTTNDWDSG
jgi:hypothetical protein